jgi:tetratricopeptide (TPR) repeat protein
LKALAKDRLDRYQTVREMIMGFKNAWKEAGVPMEGSAVMVPPSTLKRAAISEEKTEKAAPVAKAPLNFVGETSPKISGETAAVKSVPKKRRSPWLYAAGGTVFLLCCLFVGLAFRQGGFFPPRKQSTSTAPAMNVLSTPTPGAPPTQLVKPTLVSEPGDVSPEVAAARDLVSKYPDDPDAHLQLALAYWDADQPRPAAEELAQAANLAGANNRDFLLKAADKFKARDAWVATASMYLRLVQTYPVNEVPVELMEDFREAVYKASEKKDMPLFLFFERIDRIDQPLGFVARGRYALYNGTMADARLNLEQVKRIKPDSYEAFLLEAEINAKDGHPELAKPILVSLSSDLGAPEWIRKMAEGYLKTMS